MSEAIANSTLAKNKRLARGNKHLAAHGEKIKAYSERLSFKYKGFFDRAMSGEGSATEAIKAMCQHCFGYELVGESIRDCQAFTCPLYLHRPYQEGEENEVLSDV